MTALAIAGLPLLAIERLRENSRDRGFPHAAGPGKEIGLGNSFRGDGIDQRLNDVWLSDHVIKRARPVFSGRDLVVHNYVARGAGRGARGSDILFDLSPLASRLMPHIEERGQVILRHTELTAYRCFLPDLAGFTGFCCTGPSPFSRS